MVAVMQLPVGPHPRSRGENCWASGEVSSTVGSSPLTQGKHHHRHHRRPQRGLIPTHAGKTVAARALFLGVWAHPHSRRENDVHAEALIRFEGSSPLTRGKHPARGHVVEQEGLIPTHAGKTRGPGRARTRWGAHPHSRGENVRALAFMVPIVSSSPLMRGKLRVARTGQVVDGLIPAHAGKTVPCAWTRCAPGAHPRSRGENGT